MIPPSVEENADIDDAEAASVGREGDDSTTLSAKEELPSLEDRKTFLVSPPADNHGGVSFYF